MGKQLAPILAALATLLALYVGGYFALVRQYDDSGAMYWANKIEGDWTIAAHYRVGGQVAQGFFWPAHQIDLRIRREYWVRTLGPLDRKSL